MSNTHGYVSTTSCECWNIDALNRAAVYAAGDLDNGVMVVCGKPNRDSSTQMLKGYEFPVTLPTANATHLWIVNTPEVGDTFDMQLMADPRHFYNEAGKPMSIKYLKPVVDCIEADANCFANSTLPTTSQGFVTVNTDGKFVAANSAPDNGTYFSVLAFKENAVGKDAMKVVILQCERN